MNKLILIVTTMMVLIADTFTCYSQLASPSPNLKEVIVVNKTHVDLGYTHLASDAIALYRTEMIDNALNTMDAFPPERRFSWTLPAWLLSETLWEGQDPHRRKRLEEAIGSDRLAWHAIPFTMHTDACDMEDLARGFVFADQLSAKYNKPLSRTAKQTDVPEHSWFLPTLLANAGVKFIHIGTNNQCVMPDVPDFFFWEGPDGSRILVYFSKCAYGTDIIPPEDWPFETWLAMQVTGDNSGPPDKAALAALLNRADEKLPGVKVTFGTIDDFYNAISKEDLSNVPVVRADLTDTWIHGIGSMPEETAIAHNMRPDMTTLESLEMLLVHANLKENTARTPIAEARENSLLYSEHTWGSQTEGIQNDMWGEKLQKALAEYKIHGKPDTLVKPGLPFFEESFDQHRRYIWRARDIVDSLLAENLTTLAENVAVEGTRIVVYNGLPWSRDALVSIPKESLQSMGTGALKAVNITSKEENASLIHDDGTQLTFLAKDLPSNGYATFKVEKSKDHDVKGSITSPVQTVENDFFTLTVDANKGGITSLIDKKTGRELVEQGADEALGQYLFEQFSGKNVTQWLSKYATYGDIYKQMDWENLTQKDINTYNGQQMGKRFMPADVVYSANYAVHATSEISTDVLGQTVTLKMMPSGKNPDPVTLRIRLYNDLPYIDLEWEIKDKTADRIPEGGWLCLPLNIKNPTWKLGRIGAVTDPATDIVNNANFHLFALQSGVSVRGEDGYGVAVCPLDNPLVSLGEPGLWQFSESWTERKPRVYVNLFNNMWNTNFPLWIEGSWRSRVRLWPLDKKSNDWDMVGPSWEARTSCVAGVAGGKAGKLPPRSEGITISNPGVLLTAFGPDPYGEGTILRVWEQAGNSSRINVTLPENTNYKTAVPVNLRSERKGEPIQISSRSFEFELGAYAPESFVLMP